MPVLGPLVLLCSLGSLVNKAAVEGFQWLAIDAVIIVLKPLSSLLFQLIVEWAGFLITRRLRPERLA